jgi:hypothetical protein
MEENEDLGDFLNKVKSWTEVCCVYSDGADLAQAESQMKIYGFNIVNNLEEYYSMESHTGLYVPLYRMRNEEVLSEWYEFANKNKIDTDNVSNERQILGIVYLVDRQTVDLLNKVKQENILSLVGLTFNFDNN